MTRQTIVKRLRKIISRWLELDASKITFDCAIFKNAPPFELNEILVDIYSQFGVNLFINDFEDFPTFKDLVDYIERKMQEP